jgi:hypothetical protein
MGALSPAEEGKTSFDTIDRSSALPYLWVVSPFVNNKGSDNA